MKAETKQILEVYSKQPFSVFSREKCGWVDLALAVSMVSTGRIFLFPVIWAGYRVLLSAATDRQGSLKLHEEFSKLTYVNQILTEFEAGKCKSGTIATVKEIQKKLSGNVNELLQDRAGEVVGSSVANSITGAARTFKNFLGKQAAGFVNWVGKTSSSFGANALQNSCSSFSNQIRDKTISGERLPIIDKIVAQVLKIDDQMSRVEPHWVEALFVGVLSYLFIVPLETLPYKNVLPYQLLGAMSVGTGVFAIRKVCLRRMTLQEREFDAFIRIDERIRLRLSLLSVMKKWQLKTIETHNTSISLVPEYTKKAEAFLNSLSTG